MSEVKRSDELKVCPFCGGDNLRNNSERNGFNNSIVCRDCLCKALHKKTWNTRAELNQEKYNEYEFCKSVECCSFRAENKICLALDEMWCTETAKTFRKWLKENNYKIIKG